MLIREMEQKNEKDLSVSEIIAFELGLPILTILNRILAMGSQCLKKQP